MKILVPLITLVALTVSAPLLAGKPIKQQIVPADQVEQLAEQAQPREVSPRSVNTLSCRSYPKPGSRFEEEQCMTRAQWALQRMQTRMDLQVAYIVR